MRTKIIVAVVVLCLVVVALLLLVKGPMRSATHACPYCGRARVERWNLGIQTKDTITLQEFTPALDRLAPTHSEHDWRIISESERGWFTGETVTTSPLPTGARILPLIERLDAKGESEKAGQFLKDYHGMLDRGVDRAELTRFGDELERSAGSE